MKPTWERDGIALYLGDALQVLPQIETGAADAGVTDPPYGVNLTETRTKFTVAPASYLSTDDSPEAVLSIVLPAIAELRRIASAVAVTPGTRLLQDYPKADDIGVIFMPNGAGIGRWGFICAHPILYYGKCPYLANKLGMKPSSVAATHWNRRKHPMHPVEKPFKMMEWLVDRVSLPGQTVIDPFMGSGTTIIAAIESGRKAIGIEIDPTYFADTVDRVEAAINQGRLPFSAPRTVERELPLGVEA